MCSQITNQILLLLKSQNVKTLKNEINSSTTISNLVDWSMNEESVNIDQVNSKTRIEVYINGDNPNYIEEAPSNQLETLLFYPKSLTYEDVPQSISSEIVIDCEAETLQNDENYSYSEKIDTHSQSNDCEIQNETHSTKQGSVKKKKAKPKCEICQKVFRDNKDLRRHIMVHTGEKPFQCEFCGRRFSKKSNMNNHKLIHSGVKSFGCELCDKKFFQQSSLKQHMMTHSGKGGFECEICKKKLTQKSHMKEHMLTHTGVKTFKCDTCGKAFMHKSSLRQHSFIHTDAKSLKCSLCNTVFARSSYLKTHMAMHTNDERFECEICRKKFWKKSHLNAHILEHVSNLPNSK